MKKRILIPIIVLALALALAVGAAAAGEQVVFTVGNAEVVPGGTAEVTVSIDANPGIAAFYLPVELSDGLTYIGGVGYGLLTPGSGESFDGDGIAWFGDVSSGDQYGTGLYCTLLIKVPADAAAGTAYTVTLGRDVYGDYDVTNYNEEDFNVIVNPGSITVGGPCPGHETDDEHTHAEEPATCVSEGVAAYYQCIHCGLYFSDAAMTRELATIVLPPIPHHFTETPAVEATCQTDGHKAYYYCDLCERYYDDDVDPEPIDDLDAWLADTGEDGGGYASDPNHHAFGERHQGFDAECGKPGQLTYYECTVCGRKFDSNQTNGAAVELEEVELPALTHEFHDVEMRLATQIAKGLLPHQSCSNACCRGKYFLDGEEVPLSAIEFTAQRVFNQVEADSDTYAALRESAEKLGFDLGTVVYELTSQVSYDNGETWEEENLHAGAVVLLPLPDGVTAENFESYEFLVQHLTDDGSVETYEFTVSGDGVYAEIRGYDPVGLSYRLPEPEPEPTAEPETPDAGEPAADEAPVADGEAGGGAGAALWIILGVVVVIAAAAVVVVVLKKKKAGGASDEE